MHRECHKRRYSNYESDPNSARCEHDAFSDVIANLSDSEFPNSTPGSFAAKDTHYEGTREAVGDVNRFEQECNHLSEDHWAPFMSAHGFKLASWIIQNKLSKSQVKNTSQMASVIPR